MSTTILMTAGTIAESERGQSFDSVVRALWSADYFGADLPMPTTDIEVRELETGHDRTIEALMALADRTFDERETPAHLVNAFGFFGIECFDEPDAERGAWTRGEAQAERRAA